MCAYIYIYVYTSHKYSCHYQEPEYSNMLFFFGKWRRSDLSTSQHRNLNLNLFLPSVTVSWEVFNVYTTLHYIMESFLNTYKEVNSKSNKLKCIHFESLQFTSFLGICLQYTWTKLQSLFSCGYSKRTYCLNLDSTLIKYFKDVQF